MKPHIRVTNAIHPNARWVCYTPLPDNRQMVTLDLPWGFGKTPLAAFQDWNHERVVDDTLRK